MTEHFVVETIHEGSDWCVRKATASEIADPEEETLSYADAAKIAGETAREFGCKWFDFSSDPAPDDDGTSVVQVVWKDEGDWGFITTMTKADVEFREAHPNDVGVPFDPNRVRRAGSLAQARKLAKEYGAELVIA